MAEREIKITHISGIIITGMPETVFNDALRQCNYLHGSDDIISFSTKAGVIVIAESDVLRALEDSIRS